MVRGPDLKPRKRRPPNPVETRATKANGMWHGNDKGPPVRFTEERKRALAVEICTRIAGGETLTEICEDGHMPTVTTFYEWKMGSKELAEAYSCARVDQAHTWADEIRDMAKNTDVENWKPRQIQINALQWLCARLHPHQYSDRIQLTGEGGGPIEIITRLAGMKDAELDQFMSDQQRVGRRALYAGTFDYESEPEEEGTSDNNGGESPLRGSGEDR